MILKKDVPRGVFFFIPFFRHKKKQGQSVPAFLMGFLFLSGRLPDDLGASVS